MSSIGVLSQADVPDYLMPTVDVFSRFLVASQTYLTLSASETLISFARPSLRVSVPL